jgi:N-glycosylase/DNA lyase
MKHRYTSLEELRREYAAKRAAIQKRLLEFKAIPPERYFYELAYCCMTPQSSAAHSAKAQAMLEQHDFYHADIDPTPLLYQPHYYIRFHKSKAKWLIKMKENFAEILSVVTDGFSAFEKREWLAANVMGLSYKEATHFLRNVGMNDGLAILDRHILKNLQKHRVIRTIPTTLTKKRYFRIERKFQQFALSIGIPIDELDLLFWSAEAGEILK